MDNKPSVNEFIIEIEHEFGQPLVPRAELAVIDFLDYWTEILNGIKEERLKILVDMLMLHHNFPKIGSKRRAEKFWETLIAEVQRTPLEGGMARLCANYIAGTIALESQTFDRDVHWPERVSNVITGSTDRYDEI